MKKIILWISGIALIVTSSIFIINSQKSKIKSIDSLSKELTELESPFKDKIPDELANMDDECEVQYDILNNYPLVIDKDELTCSSPSNTTFIQSQLDIELINNNWQTLDSLLEFVNKDISLNKPKFNIKQEIVDDKDNPISYTFSYDKDDWYNINILTEVNMEDENFDSFTSKQTEVLFWFNSNKAITDMDISWKHKYMIDDVSSYEVIYFESFRESEYNLLIHDEIITSLFKINFSDSLFSISSKSLANNQVIYRNYKISGDNNYTNDYVYFLDGTTITEKRMLSSYNLGSKSILSVNGNSDMEAAIVNYNMEFVENWNIFEQNSSNSSIIIDDIEFNNNDEIFFSYNNEDDFQLLTISESISSLDHNMIPEGIIIDGLDLEYAISKKGFSIFFQFISLEQDSDRMKLKNKSIEEINNLSLNETLNWLNLYFNVL